MIGVEDLSSSARRYVELTGDSVGARAHGALLDHLAGEVSRAEFDAAATAIARELAAAPAPARNQDDLPRVLEEVLAAATGPAGDPGDEHADPAAAPPPASDGFAVNVRRTANAIACRLGGPVYLCGSALTEPCPADYDVRVVLGDADIDRLFGARKPRQDDAWYGWDRQELRMGREQLKQSRRLSRRFRCNVDFQIQRVDEFAHHEGKPRLRLDSIPDEVFAAGLGEP